MKDSASTFMFADNDSVIQAKLWPNDLTFISLLPHYEALLSYENDIQHFCHCTVALYYSPGAENLLKNACILRDRSQIYKSLYLATPLKNYV